MFLGIHFNNEEELNNNIFQNYLGECYDQTTDNIVDNLDLNVIKKNNTIYIGKYYDCCDIVTEKETNDIINQISNELDKLGNNISFKIRFYDITDYNMENIF